MEPEEPDADHPYGHDRIETLATLILGVSCWRWRVESIRQHPTIHDDAIIINLGVSAFVVTVASIVSKEAMYHFTSYYAKKLNSKFFANAWHSRTDSLSSVAVLIGLIG